MNYSFGNRIRNLRITAGITQKKLADLMGVSPQAVCKWEKDMSCPDIMSLPRLSRIFGITIDDLFNQGQTKEEMKNEEYNQAHRIAFCTKAI
ncbi:MAG: helix-turn-helix transcriptional regulator [Sphaerochaetaceae bacterium]|jgi:transcriptional regulator with XRE-family HTH domain|nr:helix-turn-helix transcriptional regulator [Sphaerochaetaceae bacterium]NLY07690.1 helix-turn-helix transcriptional regulator [Spirochaetales bacterium]